MVPNGLTSKYRSLKNVISITVPTYSLFFASSYHLSLFPGAAPDPRQVLLFPEHRRGPLQEGFRSSRLWFAAFDAIPIVLDFSNLTPATICALPLNRSQILPPDHWLYKSRHSKLPGAVLFIYDSLQGSIRLRVPHEISAIPRLALVKLYRDILARRIDLQSWLWNIIGCLFDPLPPCSYAPLVTRWLAAPFWTGSVSKTFRAYQLPGCLPPYRFPLSMIKSFWSAPMDPRSRTVWYKILSNKLPLQHLLAKMHPQDPRCVLCHAPEDAAHFVYMCPKKLPVWESVLATHLPMFFLQPQQYLDFIMHLRHPPGHFPLWRSLTLFSVIIHNIWSSHWNFKINDIRYDDDHDDNDNDDDDDDSTTALDHLLRLFLKFSNVKTWGNP
ncbi:hypothetical protein [Absidia glauca]|uniref:Reverse transcriptase zinc-binding domain-containing protein n=1 Tax=Absidia glauca TaxID=4829 RepID=A0A168S0M1_ABSGL|nr:hypothetical protein [Absidia glauca]